LVTQTFLLVLPGTIYFQAFVPISQLTFQTDIDLV